MKRLAIVTTHPIQYYSPVFKLLHERGNIDVKVFYTLGENKANNFDPGFKQVVAWDIPLLTGYPYEWVNNIATKPGTDHFKGIINPDIVKQINTYDADALLVIGWAYSGHLKVMRHFKRKIPVYFRGDSTLLDKASWVKRAFRSLTLKWVYKHVDHVFYVGTNNKAYFKKYGVKEYQLSFASHAVDNERFSSSREKDVRALKQKLGLNNDDIVILFAGKLQDKKDPIILLDTFINLQKPDIHLLFAGNGELFDTLKHRANKANNIHFIDFINQTDMPVIYQACDLFCLPSKGPGETWGLAVNEAMASGRAILVSDKVGCAIDLVQNNVNGHIFTAESVTSLISALKHLTRSKTLLAEYGAQSFYKIKDWNFYNIAQAIENKLIHETV